VGTGQLRSQPRSHASAHGNLPERRPDGVNSGLQVGKRKVVHIVPVRISEGRKKIMKSSAK